MALKDRIKEARIKRGYTQEQVGRMVGVKKNTFNGYEKGVSEPSLETICKIMNALNVDANFLWQDDIQYSEELSYEELELVRKYRILDKSGRETVDFILGKEAERKKKEDDSTALIAELQKRSERIVIERNPYSTSRLLPYAGRIAAAGTSVDSFSSILDGTVEVPDTPESRNADFVIGLNGDSMEPEYSDGDIVLIKKMPEVGYGTVGLFQRGNELYIKECTREGLRSFNPNYKLMADEEEVICIGKVVGKTRIVENDC